jgi:hypothetical protein
MGQFRKDAKIATVVVAAALLFAQLLRIEKTNPPLHADIPADTAIKPLLQKACYNCHSNETVWPWYSNVAPASWLVASDVKEARERLNFSEWGSYGRNVQAQKLLNIADEMKSGDMPPWYYSLMHPESRLGESERDQIRNWALSGIDQNASAPPNLIWRAMGRRLEAAAEP